MEQDLATTVIGYGLHNRFHMSNLQVQEQHSMIWRFSDRERQQTEGKRIAVWGKGHWAYVLQLGILRPSQESEWMCNEHIRRRRSGTDMVWRS